MEGIYKWAWTNVGQLFLFSLLGCSISKNDMTGSTVGYGLIIIFVSLIARSIGQVIISNPMPNLSHKWSVLLCTPHYLHFIHTFVPSDGLVDLSRMTSRMLTSLELSRLVEQATRGVPFMQPTLQMSPSSEPINSISITALHGISYSCMSGRSSPPTILDGQMGRKSFP